MNWLAMLYEARFGGDARGYLLITMCLWVAAWFSTMLIWADHVTGDPVAYEGTLGGFMRKISDTVKVAIGSAVVILAALVIVVII